MKRSRQRGRVRSSCSFLVLVIGRTRSRISRKGANTPNLDTKFLSYVEKIIRVRISWDFVHDRFCRRCSGEPRLAAGMGEDARSGEKRGASHSLYQRLRGGV